MMILSEKRKYKRLNAFMAVFLLVLLLFASPVYAESYDCAAGRHKYTVIRRIEATEEKDGGIDYKCDLCGYEYTEILPATGHHWGKWVIDKQPTCTKSGSRHRTCDLHVPHNQTEITPPLGHDYKLTEKPPDCKHDGVKTYVCSRCGDNYDEPGTAALGCEYKESITKEPSCSEDGLKSFICTHDPDHNYTEPIPAIGHDWDGDWTVELPAEIGVPGLEVKLCQNCGERGEEREIPALAEPEELQEPKIIVPKKDVLNVYDAIFVGVEVVLLVTFGTLINLNARWVRRDRKMRKLIQALKQRKMGGK